MTAPVLSGPDTPVPGALISPTEQILYVAFAAGRRGAGSIDCIVCSEAIHQHAPEEEDPTLPWFDGHGDQHGLDPGHHLHAPAHEIGPAFGPFSYVELTYDTCRVDDGEILATWSTKRGDWVLSEFAGEYSGQAYSDATIFPVLQVAAP